MEQIKLSFDGHIATILINRANKYNAMTAQMWRQFIICCQQVKNHDQAKVLIVTGAGDKAFCAGADIDELKVNIANIEAQQEVNQLIKTAQLELERLPIATIAVINGVCFGGGVGIALSCDFRFAVSQAKFAITPAKLGLLYSIEDTRRVVNALGLDKAKWLLLTGQQINAETAQSWGLVQEVANRDAVDNKTAELTECLINNSRVSISGIKDTLAYLTNTSDKTEQEIRDLFDLAFDQADFKEGASAFIEKRQPNYL